MVNRKSILFLILLVSLFVCHLLPFGYSTDDPALEWEKTFGGSVADIGYSVQEASDGGYIIAGETASFGAGLGDVYLVKTDSQGYEEWSTTFGGTGEESGYSIQQTSDGGYIITGYTESFGAGDYDVYLVKTDSQGLEEWSTTLGGSEDDFGRSVQETSYGGYIIAGWTSSFGAGGRDFYLVKMDSQGREQWSRTFGDSSQDYGYSVQETSDGGYIIAGYTYSFGASEGDVYLVKTDSQGIEEWSRTFGGSESDWGYSVQQTSDEGYIITGLTMSFGADGFDVYLVKADSRGNLMWEKTFGGSVSDFGRSVQETSDGGYIIAGETSSFDASGYDVYLVKTDSRGNLMWEKTFGGTDSDYGYSVQETSYGGYIIAGSTESFGAGGGDVYLVKIQASVLANATCEINLSEGWNLISLPLIPDNSSIEAVLADVLGSMENVWSFDEATEAWSSYAPLAPSDLTEIVDAKGYWIDMNATATLTVYGTQIARTPLAPLPEYPVVVGWNLIGLPNIPEDQNIEFVLREILDYVETVWAFNEETNIWSSYSPGAPSDLTEMVEGRGYWINMKADAIRTISGVHMKVAILVDADIAVEIQENLNQYVVDIETIYSDIRLLTYSGNWNSPEEVRAFIQDLYYNNSWMSGVILVGELPYAIWEYSSGEIGPLPYYYEDLDGIFQDQNEDGILDYHFEDNYIPEIWVSWMRPHSDNIAQSINDYLEKCHRYYSGNIIYQDKALVAYDQDFIFMTTSETYILSQIYPVNMITKIDATEGISPQDFLNEYVKQYEITLLMVHSNWLGHGFVGGWLDATTIKALDNGSKIILIGGCSAANFYLTPVLEDNLALSYVFNNNNCMTAVAQTTIGVLGNNVIPIGALAEGDIIGEAFHKWIGYSYNQFNPFDLDRFMHGYILIGDPFIRLNNFQEFLD